jgi:hypothetical protein
MTHEANADHYDGIRHFPSKMDALVELNRLRREDNAARLPNEQPNAFLAASTLEAIEGACTIVLCDSHLAIGEEEIMEADDIGTVHILPGDDASVWFDDSFGWASDGAGHHHCPECPILWPQDDCDHDPDSPHPYCPACSQVLTHGAASLVGPNDEPLPGMTA